MHKCFVLLSVVSLVAWACTDTPESGGSDAMAAASDDGAAGSDASAGAPLPIDEFKNALHTAVCASYLKCGGHFFADPSLCLAARDRGNTDVIDALVAGVKAGKLSYDADKSRLCINGRYTTCPMGGDLPPVPQICDQVFAGTVSVGGSCAMDEFCLLGWCDKVGSADCGVCTAYAKVGDVCKTNAQCEGAATCYKSKCIAPASLAADEPCLWSHQCQAGSYCPQNDSAAAPKNRCTAWLAAEATCTGAVRCAPGLACIGNGSNPVTGKCTAPGKQGAACPLVHSKGGDLFAPDFRCQVGLVCGAIAVAGESDLTYTCLPRLKIGDACQSHDQCGRQDGGCLGKCAPVPIEGAACGGGAGPCKFGLVCDAATLTCLAPPEAGKPCIKSDCAKSAWCDATGMCQLRGALGAACDESLGDSKVCLDSLICSASKCVTAATCQ